MGCSRSSCLCWQPDVVMVKTLLVGSKGKCTQGEFMLTFFASLPHHTSRLLLPQCSVIFQGATCACNNFLFVMMNGIVKMAIVTRYLP